MYVSDMKADFQDEGLVSYSKKGKSVSYLQELKEVFEIYEVMLQTMTL